MAGPLIGLALGSGGARGWCHIGVLRGLEELGVRPDVVSGCSMGAVVGAAHASGRLDALEEWALGLTLGRFLKLISVDLAGGGLVDGQVIEDVLAEIGIAGNIEDLPRPFRAVASDMRTGREVWLREGPVGRLVRASAAIPGVFAPVRHDGRWLMDGGMTNPVPVSLARAMGAEIVIAVNPDAHLSGAVWRGPGAGAAGGAGAGRDPAGSGRIAPSPGATGGARPRAAPDGARKMRIGIDGDHDLRSHRAGQRNRHRIGHTAIHEPAAIMAHRREHPRNGRRGAHQPAHGALPEPDLAPGAHVARNSPEGPGQILDVSGNSDLGQHILDHLPIDQPTPRQIDRDQLEEPAERQPQRPFLERVQPAAGMGRAHHRTHRAAGHHIGPDAKLLEPPEHADMAPSAGTAAAQGKSDQRPGHASYSAAARA